MTNSVDLDQMPHSVASDQGLHCLLKLVCPNTLGYNGSIFSVCQYILPISMILYTDNKSLDQTDCMHKLIWVFFVPIVQRILFSCQGKNNVELHVPCILDPSPSSLFFSFLWPPKTKQ